MKEFLINYNDVVEVFSDELYNSLEPISYSKDSMGNRIVICRCKKYDKQDPEFIVFKVEIKDGKDRLFILPGSVDLFRSVFPNDWGRMTNFNNSVKSNFSERLRKLF